jgi:galactokinase
VTGEAAAWLPAPSDEEVAGALAQAFSEAYGAAPSGVWAAPGRVNLIGEHTDYNDGLCLPMALPHATYAAVRLRADGTVRVRSRQAPERWEGPLAEVGPGSPPGWAAYPLGVLWALAERGVEVPGLDVMVDGRVPVGSGLSSSAALECAVAVAVAELVPAAAQLSREELARACVRAENVVAGASTGGMDQAVSLRARAGHAMLLDCSDFEVTHVPWRLASAGWGVLVMDTRAPHALVDGQYAARRRACEQAAAALGVPSLRELSPPTLDRAVERLGDPVLGRRTRHVVTETERVRQAAAALDAADADALGTAMVASHRSLRDDYEVSCPELDLAVETALGRGAVGARMTGGGFGGSAIALVRQDEATEVAQAVAEAFARRGFADPQFLMATPSGPAGRVA